MILVCQESSLLFQVTSGTKCLSGPSLHRYRILRRDTITLNALRINVGIRICFRSQRLPDEVHFARQRSQVQRCYYRFGLRHNVKMSVDNIFRHCISTLL